MSASFARWWDDAAPCHQRSVTDGTGRVGLIPSGVRIPVRTVPMVLCTYPLVGLAAILGASRSGVLGLGGIRQRLSWGCPPRRDPPCGDGQQHPSEQAGDRHCGLGGELDHRRRCHPNVRLGCWGARDAVGVAFPCPPRRPSHRASSGRRGGGLGLGHGLPGVRQRGAKPPIPRRPTPELPVEGMVM